MLCHFIATNQLFSFLLEGEIGGWCITQLVPAGRIITSMSLQACISNNTETKMIQREATPEK